MEVIVEVERLKLLDQRLMNWRSHMHVEAAFDVELAMEHTILQ